MFGFNVTKKENATTQQLCPPRRLLQNVGRTCHIVDKVEYHCSHGRIATFSFLATSDREDIVLLLLVGAVPMRRRPTNDSKAFGVATKGGSLDGTQPKHSHADQKHKVPHVFVSSQAKLPIPMGVFVHEIPNVKVVIFPVSHQSILSTCRVV